MVSRKRKVVEEPKTKRGKDLEMPNKSRTRTSADKQEPSPAKQKQEFQCQICFAVSYSQADYVNHILDEHSGPKVTATEPETVPEHEEPEDIQTATVDEELPTFVCDLEDEIVPKKEKKKRKKKEKIIKVEEPIAEEVEEALQIAVEPHVAVEGSLYCPDCKKTYLTPSHFRLHRESNCGRTRNFACQYCEAKFVSHATLNAHLLIHVGSKSFRCEHCPKSFISAGQLRVHVRQHTNEKPFECSVCNKRFAYRESVVTHSSVHTGIKPYQCLNCKSQFSCIGNLLKHRKTRPDTCGLPEFCKTVKIAPRPTTKTPGLLTLKPLRVAKKPKRNVVQEVQEVETEENWKAAAPNDYVVFYEVPQEEAAPPRKRQSKSKIAVTVEDSPMAPILNSPAGDNSASVEVSDDGGQLLDTDNYTFSAPMDEEAPREDNEEEFLKPAAPKRRPRRKVKAEAGTEVFYIAFGADEEPVKTKTSKTTTDKDWKRKSEIRHECEKCLISFAVKKSLLKHQETNCGRVSSHVCRVCSKGYSSASTLRTHMSCHTGDRPFECGECLKKFRTQIQLNVHIRVHTGEKPYGCTVCSRSFAHRETLITHQSTHSGYKRFLCISCGARFSCISNLQSHRRARKETCGAEPAHIRPVGENEDVSQLMLH